MDHEWIRLCLGCGETNRDLQWHGGQAATGHEFRGFRSCPFAVENSKFSDQPPIGARRTRIQRIPFVYIRVHSRLKDSKDFHGHPGRNLASQPNRIPIRKANTSVAGRAPDGLGVIRPMYTDTRFVQSDPHNTNQVTRTGRY
jgi:hypothetical protein